MSARTSLRSVGEFLRSLFTNVYFWGGLGALFVLLAAVYILFNSIIMPTYTRHDDSIDVPEVTNLSYDEAAEILRARDLRVEQSAQRYNPNLPLDVVSEQSPPANANVKPGRRVYLTINTGQTPMVSIPSLEGSSVREARNRLNSLGLEVDEMRADSIPSPYQNTITRQEPAPGDSLERGSGVTLWYSTGLGQETVTVPEVTNITVREAREELLSHKIRSVVIVTQDGDEIDDDEEEQIDEETLNQKTVVRQSREPGTRVPQGFEVRLFVDRGEG